MNIIKNYVTNSDCYKTGQKIYVKGIMIHSVGCPQPKASVFVGQWNRPGRDVCAHAIIDGITGDIHQTLPWTSRGWHAGDSANDTHIGIEMGESDTIRYTSGANWVDEGDGSRTKAITERTYKSAVELVAYLCKSFKLNPLKDGVIVSHYEGGKRGIASCHADPEHIWKKYGYTMDKFRNDVKAAMGNVNTNTTTTNKTTSTSKTLYKVQIGAFSAKSGAETTMKKAKAAGFDAIIVKSGKYYKVQIGAFSAKSGAETTMKKAKAAGFDAIIVKSGGSTTKTSTPSIKVGSTVKVKNGAKTYDGVSLASFVYSRNHKVSEISGNRVVITYNGDVVAAVKKSDLIIV